jgi:redox-sensitive bicupin YhaK (pirin superfamily)
MSQNRAIRQVLKAVPTMEGAGVHLKRVFGFNEEPIFDPFLLLDDFRGDEPRYYIAGFPWHPHRGIETITYVLRGEVEHGDSLGNKGSIGLGDVQWMTAGSGIIHQEMPQGDEEGKMWGFQLWANLPASHKMMSPRYQEIASDQIPEVVLDGGARVRVICGAVYDQAGPVKEIVIDPEYLDVTVPAGSEFTHRTKLGHTVFAYVFEGQGEFGPGDGPHGRAVLGNGHLVLFGDGDQITVSTGDQPVRFLLISGRPIGEPIAWRGPIVMNTQEELLVAFQEYRNGTFIK